MSSLAAFVEADSSLHQLGITARPFDQHEQVPWAAGADSREFLAAARRPAV